MHRIVRGGLVMLGLAGAIAWPGSAQVNIEPEAIKPLPVHTPLGHVEVMGTGPIDMVLIPGLYVDWSVWESFMQRNAGRYTMYAVTLPGFGATGAPPIQRGQKYSSKLWINNVVEQVVGMIEERGLDKPVVIGHSIGGQVAMRLASEHGDSVSRVVSLDTLPAMPLPWNQTNKALPQAERNRIVDELWGPAMDEHAALTWQHTQALFLQGQMRSLARAEQLGDMASAVPKEIASRYFLELASQDLTDEILSMDTPMLTIGASPSYEVMGGRPGAVPADWRVFQAKIEGHDHLKFIVFNDCAHYITEDAPEELDKAVDGFVQGKLD